MTFLRFFFIVSILFSLGCKQQPTPRNTIAEPPKPTEKKVELRNFLEHTTQSRIPLLSAHRGGKVYEGYPENCIETFEYVLKQTPSLIECDVEITADEVLILMHDNTLDRTTSGNGPVNQTSWSDIQKLNLKDNFGNNTNFKVPKLEEVLDWAKGKTILTLDIKRNVPFELVTELIKAKKAENYALIITYSEKAAQKVHSLHPEVLLSVSMRNESELERHLQTNIPVDRFIAFTGTREPSPGLYQKLHDMDIPCILGTLGNLDKRAEARGDAKTYTAFLQNGADILATDRPIEAAKAIQRVNTSSRSLNVGSIDKEFAYFFGISPK